MVHLRRLAAQRNGALTSSPPLLLALETATRVASVALLSGEELIAERVAGEGREGTETLLEVVDRVFRETGQEIGSVQAFGVSIGPGSFTGLRTGVATLKGLGFGHPHRAVAVSSLEALAEAVADCDLPVVPLLDARRGEFYGAVFERAGSGPGAGWRALLEEGVYRPDELAGRVPRNCRVVGEGGLLCGKVLRETLGDGVLILDSPAAPRARFIGVLAARAIARGHGCDAAQLVPRYLRRAEAEVKRTGIRFERD